MRLLLTVIITFAIGIFVFMYILPNFGFGGFDFGNIGSSGNLIGNLVNKDSPQRSINFVINSSFSNFMINVNGDVLLEGSDIGLKTSVGNLDNTDKIKITKYKGSLSFSENIIKLNGDFSEVAADSTIITSNGNVKDAVAAESIEADVTLGEMQLYVNGFIISNGHISGITGDIRITDFDGKIVVIPGENTVISGTAKNVTLMKSA
jgi:hypothetical protein